MEKFLHISLGLALAALAYLILIFIFDLLFVGFAPFLPSRPWVIDRIINNLKLKRYRKIFAFGSGKSGFLLEFEKIFPETAIIGAEPAFFAFLVDSCQIFLRKILRGARLKVIWRQPEKIDVWDAEIIYSHLPPDKLETLGRKLLFECQSGTIVISNGYVIPGLDPYKIVALDPRPARWRWLQKSRDIFRSKRKKSVQENKVYFYEI